MIDGGGPLGIAGYRGVAAIQQFLVYFQARGALREGQGDPGARWRPENPEKLLKPM